MATYYVRKSGNDGNAGTSAGAAWLTLGKALGASGATGGDTVYVGPGVYAEIVSVAASPSSELKVIGDRFGQFTGDTPGEVKITGHTSGDSSAASTADPVLKLNSKNNLTFEWLTVVGSATTNGAACAHGWYAAGTGITFNDCLFINHACVSHAVTIICAAGTTHNWTFNRCRLWSAFYSALLIEVPRHTSDYNTNIVLNNCILEGVADTVYVNPSGAGAGFGGGIKFYNCHIRGAVGVHAGSGASGGTHKIVLKGCQVIANQCLLANTTAQIDESYNWLLGLTPRTNVTAGTGTITNSAQAFELHLGRDQADRVPFAHDLAPVAGGRVLGFVSNLSSLPTTDLTGRTRPAGGSSLNYAVGPLELHDTAAQETGTVDAGSNAAVITGPGNQHWLVPVTAASTTISCRLRFDTTYGGTGTKPTIRLLANPSIGVTTSSAVCTAAANTWQTVSLGAFTPTAAGVVTIRIESTPDAGGGKCFVDTFTVA